MQSEIRDHCKIMSNNAESDVCAICLDDLCSNETAKPKACDHIFHESCMIKWYQTKNKTEFQCPYCKVNSFSYEKKQREDNDEDRKLIQFQRHNIDVTRFFVYKILREQAVRIFLEELNIDPPLIPIPLHHFRFGLDFRVIETTYMPLRTLIENSRDN